MIRAIETYVKSAFPQRTLAAGSFIAIATDTQVSVFVQKRFPLDANHWFGLVNSWRKSTANGSFPLGVLSAELLFSTGRSGRRLFLPLVRFLPGVAGIAPDGRLNRYADDFWRGLAAQYRGKRMLVFDGGSHLYGFLETTMEPQERDEWLWFLADHDRVVDRAWVDYTETDGSGGLVPVAGSVEPKLVRWVYL